MKDSSKHQTETETADTKGCGYNSGDDWDHTDLGLIGNTVVQDQRMVPRHEEVTR